MSKYQILGDTHVGKKYAENQDRILIREIDYPGRKGKIHLFGVADGISGFDFGGSVARWLMERQLLSDAIFDTENENIGDQLEDYLKKLYQKFCKDLEKFPAMLNSGASLSVCALYGNNAACFWVGDSPIFLSRYSNGKYETIQVSIADYDHKRLLLTDWFGGGAPFKLKRKEVEMPVGAILTIASDGALLDRHVVDYQYNEFGFTNTAIADIIANGLKPKWADDVSIVACHRLN